MWRASKLAMCFWEMQKTFFFHLKWRQQFSWCRSSVLQFACLLQQTQHHELYARINGFNLQLIFDALGTLIVALLSAKKTLIVGFEIASDMLARSKRSCAFWKHQLITVLFCSIAVLLVEIHLLLLLVYLSSSLGWRYGANSNPGSRHQPNWIRPGEKWQPISNQS